MRNYNWKLIFGGLAVLSLCFCAFAVAQDPAPANVAGNWTFYSKSETGKTATQYIQLKQDGNKLTGHFKGPHQSGSLEGTVNGNEIFFRTHTREVLGFRGRVVGEGMQGTFHIRGIAGEWQARRSN